MVGLWSPQHPLRAVDSLHVRPTRTCAGRPGHSAGDSLHGPYKGATSRGYSAQTFTRTSQPRRTPVEVAELGLLDGGEPLFDIVMFRCAAGGWLLLARHNKPRTRPVKWLWSIASDGAWLQAWHSEPNSAINRARRRPRVVVGLKKA